MLLYINIKCCYLYNDSHTFEIILCGKLVVVDPLIKFGCRQATVTLLVSVAVLVIFLSIEFHINYVFRYR